MNKSRYKEGDVVLVQSCAGPAIPPFHVKLLKKHIAKEQKNGITKEIYPAYIYWEAILIYQKEVDILRKEWHISFKKAKEDLTYITDSDIIKKQRR